VSVPRGTATVSSLDLSKRDLTLDLARVFSVLLVVVIHLLFVGVGTTASGELVVSRPLEEQPWFDGATWVGQIMPLFFVVGGFASITAWRSSVRRGGTAADYIRTRVLRLAQPSLPLFVFYVVVIGGATLIGVDPVLLDTVVLGAGSPLWFIAAYTLCQALVPVAVRLHARAPVATLAVLAAGVIAVDALRYGTGIVQLGYFNMLFVWLLVQQFGFWYADGWFARRRWWQLLGLAAVAYALLALVTLLGPYDTDMLTNLNPPTLPLVLLGLAQAALLRLLRPALAALMNTHIARAVVFLVGSRLMTIYLWHLPLIIIVAGVGLLIPGASPEPASPAWWWSRPLVYLLVLGLLFALSFLVGRWEQPREVGGTPPIGVVALAAGLTFIAPFLAIEFFLDLWIAALGSAAFGAAILLLGRWPGGARSADAQPAAATPSSTAARRSESS